MKHLDTFWIWFTLTATNIIAYQVHPNKISAVFSVYCALWMVYYYFMEKK